MTSKTACAQFLLKAFIRVLEHAPLVKPMRRNCYQKLWRQVLECEAFRGVPRRLGPGQMSAPVELPFCYGSIKVSKALAFLGNAN